MQTIKHPRRPSTRRLSAKRLRQAFGLALAAALAWTLQAAVPAQAQTANLALSATPSASYTSSWETVSAINDGIAPPGSNDTANPRWGTWPETGEQWVQLSWSRPVTVSSSDIYFFDDSYDGGPDGVRVPAGWSLQYLAGSTWTPMSADGAYGTAANRFNTVSFDPVTTTAVRAVLQSGAASVGVLEWRVHGSGSGSQSGNPIVTDIYTADPATLVADDTMYVFTGRDEAAPGQQGFVMDEWHAFSSTAPDNDPDAWEAHGAVLSLDVFDWAGANAWASEVEQGPDGRYYWFVSVDGATDNGWMNIGVAVADDPLGPYEDAIGAPLIADSTPNSSALNIDPTVFIDDDGRIYMYWGSYWQPRMVRLNQDMTSLAGAVTTPQGLTDFWEAPWMFERDGTYYMAYASNGGSGCVTDSAYACIRYATASSPAGPWTHRGVVLGQVTSTTNHPAIEQFDGQWWMVYHTADAPGGGNFRRSVAIDELHFNADGTMQQVVQTAGGAS
ncbi:family 43 glycosylhydrolase [Glycomyces sp. A-F 0318]|uniref:family 43 glycosylhydrolase n=1 Tax=Glycomyces amatae TaxID=2881355 RepID=UPI001E4E43C5|nr:family 43 glycosylhydrolase [Glycomyces amatae]MCD0443234.1 family 43 glycosylhydrolase [Glycomyces amatae]